MEQRGVHTENGDGRVSGGTGRMGGAMAPSSASASSGPDSSGPPSSGPPPSGADSSRARASAEDPLGGFSAATRAWFEAAFEAPTPAQVGAWTAIDAGR